MSSSLVLGGTKCDKSLILEGMFQYISNSDSTLLILEFCMNFLLYVSPYVFNRSSINYGFKIHP